jgi:hypothetical protein
MDPGGEARASMEGAMRGSAPPRSALGAEISRFSLTLSLFLLKRLASSSDVC